MKNRLNIINIVTEDIVMVWITFMFPVQPLFLLSSILKLRSVADPFHFDMADPDPRIRFVETWLRIRPKRQNSDPEVLNETDPEGSTTLL